ncbi:uncharacterized protein TRIADDRAFT_26322 [Trichoplax adhaerens]|uniref:LAA1-like C-terminal TPR repeats domain-containing protein n=1 Tax=Trichoplax adhaerens TaxID=10228 RepID=B3RZ01_TRIAD|nr:hypothetical protein TRIADDRAFT_26322 [Trichoplax adhaerens]EDV23758.1 hypothetical protein TRIADDRAFT_26322 [Trichoplax adhaerens]|eukprot:XP_002113284.1 hypothetical protein TRIADDRAFT_26322 [Trichoplax adhaerens]
MERGFLPLNKKEYENLPGEKRSSYACQWLQNLHQWLIAAPKANIKPKQKEIVETLQSLFTEPVGQPVLHLLGKCLATVYSVGDTSRLLESINYCVDIMRLKDDSTNILGSKLAAVICIGCLYEKMGKMFGFTLNDAVQSLLRYLKVAEAEGRREVMVALEKILSDLGASASSVYKDIYKAIKYYACDRALIVRAASINVAIAMAKEAPFLYTTELDNMVSLCFRVLEGSNYDVRCAVAELLGQLAAMTQHMAPIRSVSTKTKRASLDDVLNLLSAGFMKTGTGFLKSGSSESLKGNTASEVRVGVAQGYVAFFKLMGRRWIEQNMSKIINHVIEIVSMPKAASSHVQAVYLRQCILFILRNVLNKMLGESSQLVAVRELFNIIFKKANSALSLSDSDSGSEFIGLSHVLVCGLLEVGNLIQSLGTISNPFLTESTNTGSNTVLESISSVMLLPNAGARLAAAWCLRCIAIASPSQLTPLLDWSMTKLKELKSSPEAVIGYAHILAALVGAVSHCPLGIPSAKGRDVFLLAKDLLTTQNNENIHQRLLGGWAIVGALMTLGTPFIRLHLSDLITLWSKAFPKSDKEAEEEKSRGNAASWLIILESRAGALCAIRNFIHYCGDLFTETISGQLMVGIEYAVTSLRSLSTLVKNYTVQMKAATAMFRLRLYQTLHLIKPVVYESLLRILAEQLVHEFTLSDNHSNTTTSLLRNMCHKDDTIILGYWLADTDSKAVEDQLQPNSASGSGALEHDPACVYSYQENTTNMPTPGPLPLGVAVIDSAITLFGVVFVNVTEKQRVQLLEHFSTCIKQSKSSRQQAVQINIFTAFLTTLKVLSEDKKGLGQEDVRTPAYNLIMSTLVNPDSLLRCAAGEALGRMAQVVGFPAFVAQTAQNCFDNLKSTRNGISRTGHSLALGCLHRYVGGMGSGHHLKTSISILTALAQDTSSTLVQVWALHALALIADSGGPMFRSYVEPTLNMVRLLLLSTSLADVEVYQCLGKCLAAMITTVGPELQDTSSSITKVRDACFAGCVIMQEHPHALVKFEAINCFQQLHMFASKHVDLASLVPRLCSTLSSPHLQLRRAAVSCLRQFTQREAQQVCVYAKTVSNTIKSDDKTSSAYLIGQKGLEGVLFGMLDNEFDPQLITDIKDILVSILITLAPTNLSHWLYLCRDILSASGNAPLASKLSNQDNDDDDDGEGTTDDAKFAVSSEPESHAAVAPRWPTRVFALECTRKIMDTCAEITEHLDMTLAHQMKQEKRSVDYLVMHISTLIRISFIAATSNADQLRLAGLDSLQEVIRIFATIPDVEFPGHVILEQYQAQVGAALRPAFSSDTPPDVTAMACEVCSSWLGSGVLRDVNDLRRVQQLLVASLGKLRFIKDDSGQTYSESASTMEKLAVLNAWAEVYIIAMRQESIDADGEGFSANSDANLSGEPSLIHLVQPDLITLSKNWLAVLRDCALLSLPSQLLMHLPSSGGVFFNLSSMEATRPHYRRAWPPILHATALWLNNGGFHNLEKEPEIFTAVLNIRGDAADPKKFKNDQFNLLFGLCIEALCSAKTVQDPRTVAACLNAIYNLLDSKWTREVVTQDVMLVIELLNVIHRLLLMRENLGTQVLVLEVVTQTVKSVREKLEREKSLANSKDSLGEGGDTGDILPGRNVAYAIMEACVCVLLRQIPSLNPPDGTPNSAVSQQYQSKPSVLTENGTKLVCVAIGILASIPDICSPAGSLTVLPTILYLTIGALTESGCGRVITPDLIVSSVLQALCRLFSSYHLQDVEIGDEWIRLFQSSLATLLHVTNKQNHGQVMAGLSNNNLLQCLATFILYGPKAVTLTESLHKDCTSVFETSLKQSDPQTKLQCLQVLSKIFQCTDEEIAVPYIRILAPHVIMIIHESKNQKLQNELQLKVCSEAIIIFIQLLEQTDEISRSHLLVLLIPVLIDCLLDANEFSKATSAAVSLHDYSLSQLMNIGPKHPQAFKAIMANSPNLKQRLESAIKHKQSRTAKKQSTATARASPISTTPTIQLKMDFSNFKGK